jgi:hypothetical protein
VVYLSSNSLRSLEGADQFQGLRVLSAASNLIERADDVVALLNCPQLEVRLRVALEEGSNGPDASE